MTPLRKSEVALYGHERAPARIPLIIKGENVPAGVENLFFQQTDLAQSIMNLTSSRHCTSDWKGDLLNAPVRTPRYIIHRRGDRRDMLSAFVGEKNLSVKLAGDKTRVLGKQRPEARDHDAILTEINRRRIAGSARD